MSIGASTKGLGREINKQFTGMEAQADKSSSRVLSSLSGALGTAAKIAAGTVAVLGGGLVALAAKGGFDRALAIDNAQAKMVALGYSAGDVESVMESALNSVKGTAFGLGDAASLASQFLAAGVGQGEDLDRALRNAADAAAVAGVPLSDLQSVFGQLASGSQLYTQDLLQLQSRGLPVFTWLADSMGTTVDAVRDMVSAGELGFADLQKAIDENIGGAAKNTDSFSASWMNVRAALSRTGAIFAVPGLAALKELFDASIPAIDKFAEIITPLAETMFSRLRPALDSVTDGLAAFAAGDIDLAGIFASINPAEIAAGIIPAIQNGLASAADWLANGGIQTLVDGFLAGRAALFDAGMQIVPAILEAIQTILPSLGGVAVQVVAALAALLPEVLTTIVAMIPLLLDTAITLFSTLIDAIVTILPMLVNTLITLLPQVANAILMALPQLLMAALSLFQALINGLMTVLPMLLMTLLTQVLPAVLTTVLAMLPQLLTTAIEVFFALIDAILVILPQLIQMLIGDVLPALIVTLYEMIPMLLSAAIQVFMALVDAIIKIVPTLVKALGSAIMALLAGLVEAAPKIFAGAVDMFGELGEGFKDAWPKILDWLGSIPGKILDAWSDAGEWLLGIGGDIIDGLIDGLKGGFQNVKDALGSLTDMLPDWKGPAQVDARLLTDNGRLIMQSLIDGFRDETPAVKAQLQGLTSSLASAASMDVAPAQSDPYASSMGATEIIQLVVEGRVLSEIVRQHDRRLA